MSDTTEDTQNSTVADTEPNDVSVEWDDSEIASSYANIATATATQEEFFLLFGVHQNWKGLPADGKLNVKLNDRIVLNPHAAKRLATVLVRSIKMYEDRFGKITT